jgi:2-dehydro-3-deoxygalactonokinase
LSETNTFIAADWGTSHLRVFLCHGSRALERREGPGVAALSAAADGTTREQAFAKTLSATIGPWAKTHGDVPIWVAGMAGSRNGWRETGYVPCPVDARALAQAMLRFECEGHTVAIVPGARCTNVLGAPDVMRGEETQILGALARFPAIGRGRHVVALPGTHTKWALLGDGRLTTFQTSFSGELYALLREYSMLARAGAGSPSETAADEAAPSRESFERGLFRIGEHAGTALSHLLFEVRSRQLVEGMPRHEALAYLSGLIVGQDVEGAMKLFHAELREAPAITVIGSPQLTDLYGLALGARNLEARPMDAAEATIRGLHEIAHAAAN